MFIKFFFTCLINWSGVKVTISTVKGNVRSKESHCNAYHLSHQSHWDSKSKRIYHQQFFIVFALPPPGRVFGRVRELPTKFSWLPPTTHSLEREVTDIQKFHPVFAEISLRSFSRLSYCNTPLKIVCQNCFKRTSQETVLDISEVKSQHQCTRARRTEV